MIPANEPNARSVGPPPVKQVVEGALLAAGTPLGLEQLLGLYAEDERPQREAVTDAIAALQADYRGRAIELVEVAGGWRVQVRAPVTPWVARLWEERPARYSRALLETLALIAYRQPITRGEIEDIRGVAVSTQIVRTLTERDWVRVVGHRDVPGRPALLATTRRFLDDFGLCSLNDLPPLAALREPGREFDPARDPFTLDTALSSAPAPEGVTATATPPTLAHLSANAAPATTPPGAAGTHEP